MKMIVFADVHGDFDTLSSVLEKISKNDVEEADLVVCPGDFTDMFSTPEEFSQMDIADMVLQRLMSLGKPLLCIPGNHDPYEILNEFDEFGVNLHNKTKTINNIKFVGWGGAATPFDTIFEPPEPETKEALETLGEGIDSKFVLIIHNPPKDTKVDMVSSGEHVGSQAIRDFVAEKQPILAVSAHIHEATGTDKLGKTTLFNPGPVFNRQYGVVEIKGNNVNCRIKKV